MYNHIDAHIGKSIRALREEQGLSAAAFASGIAVRTSDLKDYETGKRRLPAATMMEAAILLNVDASSFFAGLHSGLTENRACPDAGERAPSREAGNARRS